MRRGWEAAALRGSVAGLEPLLAGGTGIDTGHANGPTSLMLAPAQGHDDLVAWLIERSARRVARNRPSRIAPSRAVTWRGSRFCAVPRASPPLTANSGRIAPAITVPPHSSQFSRPEHNFGGSAEIVRPAAIRNFHHRSRSAVHPGLQTLSE